MLCKISTLILSKKARFTLVMIGALPFILVQGSSSRYQGNGLYQQSGKMTWMSQSSSFSFEYLGCVWAVTEDNEDWGCLANGSSDGTSSWYMMANCRRAQVAYNVYASSSSYGTRCQSGNFKESFHTTNSLSGFVNTLSSYYSNSPITADDIYSIPSCASDGNGYYLNLGCSDDGNFVIAKFSDKYCMKPVGTYDYLKSVNKLLSKLSGCNDCYDTTNGNTACTNIISNSESCSVIDSSICGDEDGSKSKAVKASAWASRSASSSHASASPFMERFQGIGNSIKYALGSVFLLASFIMFLGILMMNRRKRRANLNRKYRQSSATGSRRERSSNGRSESEAQDRHIGGSSNRSRSKSKTRSSSKRDDHYPVDDAVYT
jgi:hypothetical protein